jgi:hypothetical protein
MAAFVKFHQFAEAVGKKEHNLDTDTLKILLSNDAPSAANDAVKADLTSELSTGGGYTSGGGTLASQDYEQTTGTAALTASDLVFTASGGTIGPFRYAVLWNDTHASDGLIGYWDYGSSITLADGETFTVDFTGSVLTLA